MALDEARYRRLKDAGFSHQAALALADDAENEYGIEGGVGVQERLTALETAVFGANPDPDGGGGDEIPTFAVGEPITDGLSVQQRMNTVSWLDPESDSPDLAIALLEGVVEGETYQAGGPGGNRGPRAVVRILSNDGSMLPEVGTGYLLGGPTENPGALTTADVTDQLAAYEGSGLVLDFVGWGVYWTLNENTLPFTVTPT